ncbi:hypothetical protein ROSEINA2194_01818 [Roseburia inulinivorans DSM 16841]|uniref:SHOCT-like domain-containing protein n=7 Tax=Clostridia TaxID=186801 RepID=C0FSV2_9FIRM|nr:hypothetical protein ROSEINA2194_01818 [Roseburia inulinivorans DSM 16841]
MFLLGGSVFIGRMNLTYLNCGRKRGEMMEGGANEVRYKIAEFLLKRMHEDKLLTEEEWEKIRVLNVKTFSPELAKVYL